jgi:hypothetical protein
MGMRETPANAVVSSAAREAVNAAVGAVVAPETFVVSND